MTIKVWDNNGITAPVLCCDVCDAPIDDANEGAAVFALVPNASSTKAMHVHKLGCHHKAEVQLGGRLNTGWQELSDHLRWLYANVGLQKENTLEKIDFTEELSQLLEFAGKTATAIRMYSACSGSSPSNYLNVPYDPQQEASDLMFLADSLHHFSSLGRALHESDPARLIEVCDQFLQNFSHYDTERAEFGKRQAKPTFERWRNFVDLTMAREAVDGIRNKAASISAG